MGAWNLNTMPFGGDANFPCSSSENITGCLGIQIYHLPGTQMTLVLIEKNLVLEGLSLKIGDVYRFQV